MIKNNSYNNTVTYFVISIETLLSGIFFYIMTELCSDNYLDDILNVSNLQVCIIMMMSYAISAATSGVVLYKRKIYPYEIISRIMSAMLKFTLLSSFILYIGKYMQVMSMFYLIYLLAGTITVILFRGGMRAMIKAHRTKGKNIRYAVFVGSSNSMADLYREMTEQKWTGYNVLGYFDYEKSNLMPSGCKYLGKPEDVTEYLEKKFSPDYVFCSLNPYQSEVVGKIINFCENNMIRFHIVPNMNYYMQNRVFIETMGDVTILSLRKERLVQLNNRIVKRSFDLLFSALFLCTLFPVILIFVTIITELTMPGPVFFRQKRSGQNDREFYCLKFRSMKVNKDADRLQATRNDPRKTKWGNIMRKLSIDELPQFINVLMGDMSVVGPRPHMLKHTEEYSKIIDKYMVRHLVKPGITGLSQVTGYRGETKEMKSMEGRVRRDIWYIENWSFWLDMYIIYKTVANVIAGEEKAY